MLNHNQPTNQEPVQADAKDLTLFQSYHDLEA